jgi:hypothetical protein
MGRCNVYRNLAQRAERGAAVERNGAAVERNSLGETLSLFPKSCKVVTL